MNNYTEKQMIDSLEKKKCVFIFDKRLIWIPLNKDTGGCTALGNDSWGRVRTLCFRYGWKWKYKA